MLENTKEYNEGYRDGLRDMRNTLLSELKNISWVGEKRFEELSEKICRIYENKVYE